MTECASTAYYLDYSKISLDSRLQERVIGSQINFTAERRKWPVKAICPGVDQQNCWLIYYSKHKDVLKTKQKKTRNTDMEEQGLRTFWNLLH